MSQNKKKLIGSIQEDLKKPASEGLRREIRFLDPEGEGDRIYYPGYLNELSGTEEVNSTPVRIYPNKFEKDGETKVRLVVRETLTSPQPAKNSSGQLVDSKGNVVESEADAALVNRAITYKGTNKKATVTRASFILSDTSHKGTPYGQTMAVGQYFDMETAKDIERHVQKAGNLKAADKYEEAKSYYEKSNAIKKEKGDYTSLFLTKNLAAKLAVDLNISIQVAKSNKHEPTNGFPF